MTQSGYTHCACRECSEKITIILGDTTLTTPCIGDQVEDCKALIRFRH